MIFYCTPIKNYETCLLCRFVHLEQPQTLPHHSGSCKLAANVAHGSRTSYIEFKEAIVTYARAMPSPNNTWSAPIFSFYKLNVDAGYNEKDNTFSCGMVIRGHDGNMILSVRIVLKDTFSLLHAKLRAILFGLQNASRENLRSRYVESDSKVAIAEIKKGTTSSFEWLSTILDIDYYSALCGMHDFSFIRRGVDKFAHNITKFHCLLDNI